MENEFNLSEKIWHRCYDIGNSRDYIEVKDVKEFIKMLKNKIEYLQTDYANLDVCNKEDVIKEIDELAGEKLK